MVEVGGMPFKVRAAEWLCHNCSHNTDHQEAAETQKLCVCVCVCVCVRAKTSVKEEREHTLREEESGFN